MYKYTGPAPKPKIRPQPKNKMNLDGVEKYFGFAAYSGKNEVVLNFVCLNLPDEKYRCFGIQVDENNIPKSSLLYILKLNELDESVVDDISVYINAYQI